MKRIVTYGCSHTLGEGVTNPEVDSWPAILGTKLNLPVLNLGVSGGSNRYIQHEVVNTDLSKDDIVLILWTYPDRYHFFESRSKHTGLINVWSESENSKFWFKNLNNSYNEQFDNQTIVNYINLFLLNKGVQVFNLVVERDFDYYFELGNFTPLDINFTRDYLKGFPRGNDGWHMGREGNIAFASTIGTMITGQSNYL